MTNSPALFGDPGSDLGVNEEWCMVRKGVWI